MRPATLAYHIRQLDRAERRALVADIRTARGLAEADVDVLADGTVRVDGQERDAAAIAEMLCYAVEPSVARRLCVDHLGAPPDELRPSPVTRARRRAARLRARADRLREAGPPTPVLVVIVAVVAAVAFAGVLPALSEPASPDASAVSQFEVPSSAVPGPVDVASLNATTFYPSPPVDGFAANISRSHVRVVADPADRNGGCDPSELTQSDGYSPDGAPVYYCISGEP